MPVYKNCKTPGYEKVVLVPKFNQIVDELNTRKDDKLDKALLKAGLQGLVSLIQENNYELSSTQIKAIIELLKRWYE